VRAGMRLDEQLQWLESTLLPAVKPGPLEQLSEQDRTAVAAYLVLAHACIEEAIEDAFLSHARAMLDLVDQDPRTTPLAVARFALNVGINLPGKKVAPYSQRKLLNTLKAALKDYEVTVVDQNHGIKEDNISNLAEGVGLEWEAFDVGLGSHIADLETLGAKRGKVGHLSPFTDKAVLVKAEINITDAKAWVMAAQDAVSAIVAFLREELHEEVPLGQAGMSAVVSPPFPA
jgi:hypothetical protein